MTNTPLLSPDQQSKQQTDSTSKKSGPLHFGRPTNRVDGKLKVTGQAKYAAEHTTEGLLYGVVVSSKIAKGRIRHINVIGAENVPGVIRILTHENRPSTAWFNRKYKDDDAPPGHHVFPLEDNEIHYSQQAIALVVAETFEAARFAASLVTVDYDGEEHQTDLVAQDQSAHSPKGSKTGFEKPKSRGDAQKAIAKGDHRLELKYSTPVEHHSPMEMHASTVIWNEGNKLRIFDKTQGVANSQTYICNVFGLKKDQVVVEAPYIGGVFGSGLRPQYQLTLAVMAALELKRSVRVVLTRPQMFSFGHRPQTLQSIQIGANKDGKLTGIRHDAHGETSRHEEYGEIVVNWSGLAYHCDHVDLEYKLVPLDLPTPLDMRAPGATLGMFALESAMDEAAYAVGLDPLEFRQRNYAERDEFHDQEFSSKELRECYRLGAEKFGWSKRPIQPATLKEGRFKIGWGMATGIWDSSQMPAGASASIDGNGHLTLTSAITDIGTGTYTILSQIAADAFGIDIENVTAKLASTAHPMAPLQGGSWSAASVGWAVQSACDELIGELLKIAREIPNSPLSHSIRENVKAQGGNLVSKTNENFRVSISEILKFKGENELEASVNTIPDPKQQKFSRHTNSSVFVEVKVDEITNMIEVSRVVCAVAAGKIINPKTARSQILGGVVWGISMALHEATLIDHNLGRFINHNFSEYHISVAKDIGPIDVIFVPESDEVVSPLGIKGLGEIGVVGTAAAVANAIFHATGKRVRDLPITPDKLI